MKHKVKVVMLPTDKASYIGVCIKEMSDVKIGELRIFSSPMFMSLEYWQPQHLYATVSQDVEPIKEVHWYIDDCNTLRQSITNDKDYWEVRQDYRKIIATDDPKLINSQWKSHYTAEESFDVARLQQSFLKEFVDNPDAEYEVEYDIQVKDNNRGISRYENWTTVKEFLAIGLVGVNLRNSIKLNQDNTVNITSVKEKMYSREEVVDIIKVVFIEGFMCSNADYCDTADEWIKENL